MKYGMIKNKTTEKVEPTYALSVDVLAFNRRCLFSLVLRGEYDKCIASASHLGVIKRRFYRLDSAKFTEVLLDFFGSDIRIKPPDEHLPLSILIALRRLRVNLLAVHHVFRDTQDLRTTIKAQKSNIRVSLFRHF